MPETVGGISLHMGPAALGAPDDLAAPIIEFVEGAQHRLDVAVQELDADPIVRALIAASARGVAVRVVVESQYMIEENGLADPFAPGGENETNRTMFAAMARAGIEIRLDLNPHTFHQKFIVRDIGETRSALLTGSTNFTRTGIGENLNHIIIVEGASVAEQYDKEFAEIWQGTFGEARMRHEPKPRSTRVGRIRIKPLFAPDHAPEMEIMKQMLKGRQNIRFAVFTFSNSSGIDDTLAAQQRAGVRVRGTIDSLFARRTWSGANLILRNGGQVFNCRHTHGLNKLHHKLIVIDDRLIIAGSFNFTDDANLLNDENVLVLGDLAEDNAQALENQERLAAYANAEIERIIGTHGEALTL